MPPPAYTSPRPFPPILCLGAVIRKQRKTREGRRGSSEGRMPCNVAGQSEERAACCTAVIGGFIITAIYTHRMLSLILVTIMILYAVQPPVNNNYRMYAECMASSVATQHLYSYSLVRHSNPQSRYLGTVRVRYCTTVDRGARGDPPVHHERTVRVLARISERCKSQNHELSSYCTRPGTVALRPGYA